MPGGGTFYEDDVPEQWAMFTGDNVAFFAEVLPGRAEPLDFAGWGGQAGTGRCRPDAGGRSTGAKMSARERARVHGVLSVPARVEILDGRGRPHTRYAVSVHAQERDGDPHRELADLLAEHFADTPAGRADRAEWADRDWADRRLAGMPVRTHAPGPARQVGT
jgi:hypothetical protein